jgi:hypothetical protein
MKTRTKVHSIKRWTGFVCVKALHGSEVVDITFDTDTKKVHAYTLGSMNSLQELERLGRKYAFVG